MLQYRALGALTVADGGEDVGVGDPRLGRLVAMVVVHRNSVVSADRLREAVFRRRTRVGGSHVPGAGDSRPGLERGKKQSDGPSEGEESRERSKHET